MSLSQIELVWFRVRLEWECFWVNLREDNKGLNPRWQCLNSTWQNSRWLPSSSYVRRNEFEADWNSLSQGFVQNGWITDGSIKDGRIQDGCHHQVRWEGMSLSQIELVWFRVRVEWECFWVNLREDNKVSESKMAVSEFNMAEFKMAAIIKLSQNESEKLFLCKMAESKMAKFKMAAIIKLRQSEWVKFFVQMVATILGKCEWVWEEKLRWLNPRWPN